MIAEMFWKKMEERYTDEFVARIRRSYGPLITHILDEIEKEVLK